AKAEQAAAPPAELPPFTTIPAPERIVAIGDLHGDLSATRRALRLAGAIDAKDAWVGGKLMIVQTGDLVDRGDDDRAILDLTERLKVDAKAAGGQFLGLVGNHEIMNAEFDFRYVTEGAYAKFGDITASGPVAKSRTANVEPKAVGRAVAFAPGGPYAKMLADRPVVARVGDTVFVHGGVLPKHVRYGLDRAVKEVHDWLAGATAAAPSRTIMGEDGLLWTRMYSAAPSSEDCQMLAETLRLLAATRLVMGHTVQRGGISDACGKTAYRIDVGMSHAYQGPIEVLEIKGDAVTVLREPK
ncbi:calcineurin, partial [bacterium]